ncbi:hypothetical protein FPL09_01815 [Spiribacter vilamensis]|nr:hypothetical protein [Spiribacter vilamensis]TVO60918.1 hypothetical protein FPL09_01815 [Spiribacter vilamensis]
MHLRRGDGIEERRRLEDAFVSPILVVLSLGGSRGRRTLVVPADALNGESHRRLRCEVRQR